MISNSNELFSECLVKGIKKVQINLSREQVEKCILYFEQLMIWNRKTNLTAIKKPDEVAEKHFIDCLMITEQLDALENLMDMGSGGGFPGIIIKIMNPSLNIVLVDSVRKKVSFLNHVIRTLDLDRIKAVHARAEDLHKDQLYAQQYDGVISRAFADLVLFTDLATPFLNGQGKIYAMKGKDGENEADTQILNNYEICTHHYQLPHTKADRSLVKLSGFVL